MNGALGIEEIKLAYRIPAAWRDLQLNGEPGKCVRSPFRDEKNPSFSVHYDGRRWHDFASGESGDVLDFVGRATGTDTTGSLRWIRERLGFMADAGGNGRKSDTKKPSIPELRCASANELSTLNERRGFGVEAMKLAQARGFLRFCNFAGQAGWCVKDRRHELYEFRRLDGEPWPAYKHLSERKSHCVGGQTLAAGRARGGRIREMRAGGRRAGFRGAVQFPFGRSKGGSRCAARDARSGE